MNKGLLLGMAAILSMVTMTAHSYACHEGNYALPGILAGAREEEKAAAAK